jgi:tripartite-type tricarboxylate transporter receptor subunit TctC
LVARLTVQTLVVIYGQPFVVEHKHRAVGSTGSEIMAQSKSDGYALAVVSGSHTINPALYKYPLHDMRRDFAPVSNLVDVDFQP